MKNDSQVTNSNGNLTFARRWSVFIGKLLISIVCFFAWLWCIGFAYCLDDKFSTAISSTLAVLIAIGIPIWCWRTRKIGLATCLIGPTVVFLACFMWFSFLKPSHEREWGIAQANLPFADMKLDYENGKASVVVHNIRSLRYGANSKDKPTHYTDTFDLSKLESVWFGVDRFTEVEPLAHTFLSFGFEPGSHRTNYLAFSVETRREKDEEMYSPLRGIYKNYEVIYVIADEEDVLSVRSDVRSNVVQLYPVRTTKEQVKTMFLDMLTRANSIRAQPEYYHTLTNNCTNNIVYHTNKVLKNQISVWERGVVLPGYSDWLAHRRGLIDTDLPLEEAREMFRIDERVQAYDGSGDFSKFIRKKD